MPERIASMALAAILATMLIGAQFGFAWAGGRGHVRPLDVRVTVGGFDELTRGEIIRVGEGYAQFLVGGSVLSVDARTDVELVSLLPERIELRVLRGRIAIQHAVDAKKITIHAGPAEVTLSTTGWVSVVHYDFRGTVSVAPVGTAISAVLQGTDSFVATAPFDYSYWAKPPTVTETSFDPAQGAAAQFSQRFLEAAGLDETAEKP